MPSEDEVLKAEQIAMNIVHQIGDALYEALPKDIAHKYFVNARQATNDRVIDFARDLILISNTDARINELQQPRTYSIDSRYSSHYSNGFHMALDQVIKANDNRLIELEMLKNRQTFKVENRLKKGDVITLKGFGNVDAEYVITAIDEKGEILSIKPKSGSR